MNSNQLLIQQSHNTFRSKIENIDTPELLEIIKNYKKLLTQLDDYNGALLTDLIQIAEKTLQNRSNKVL